MVFMQVLQGTFEFDILYFIKPNSFLRYICFCVLECAVQFEAVYLNVHIGLKKGSKVKDSLHTIMCIRLVGLALICL